ncbi:MAG: hypothetical protein WC415_02900 [Patescibacteria group bacterium]|jgi:hypothetical protein
MAKIKFNSIFNLYADGTIEPRQQIMVRGVVFGPGVRFSKGVAFAGIDFSLFINHDIEADNEGGMVIIKGIYQ